MAENSNKSQIYDRMSDDKNDESLNPLYMASKESSTINRRQNHGSRQASTATNTFLDVSDPGSGIRTGPLGRHFKLSSSHESSQQKTDMPRSASSAGVNLAGVHTAASTATAVSSKKACADQLMAADRTDETDRSQSPRPTNEVKSAPPPPVPIRLVRVPSAAKPMRNLPHINCQEKIVRLTCFLKSIYY